ncbi:hypothetical protein ABNN70_10725 [Sporolactobacillus sp. Y61]|uniref:DUF1269 domain-containing protein n=1 Tax=Sporolactobacillus sp. Y61 TaxID=3160863 RepID=A0AAU8ID46_9BACL
MKIILAMFEHSIFVEIALTSLKNMEHGFENIGAVPLKHPPGHSKLYDGKSYVDLGFVSGTVAGVIGVCLGYRLYPGPILWGISASLIGFVGGLFVDYIYTKFRRHKEPVSKILLLISCEDRLQDAVEDLMWKNQASGVAVIDIRL